MSEPRNALSLPTDEEGHALAGFTSGRLSAFRDVTGTWRTGLGEGPRWNPALVGEDGCDDEPSGVLATAYALHLLDWLDSDGKLTELGKRALNRWVEHVEAREREQRISAQVDAFHELTSRAPSAPRQEGHAYGQTTPAE